LNHPAKGVTTLEKKQCVLYDRVCIGCGECDRCDLDPEKICDNCMKCVNGDSGFRSIAIDAILLNESSGEQKGTSVL
jgi:hypothetical protein